MSFKYYVIEVMNNKGVWFYYNDYLDLNVAINSFERLCRYGRFRYKLVQVVSTKEEI